MTITSNRELIDAMQEQKGGCIKLNIKSGSCDTTSTEKITEHIPARELAERAALKKIKTKLSKIEEEHVEQYGAPCTFSAIRRAGNIFVECEVCQTETKIAINQQSLRVQAIEVHIQRDAHKTNLCNKYERLSLKSDKIEGKELKEISNAAFARELEPGTFKVSNDNVECIHCHDTFLLLPKGGSFKRNLQQHVDSSSHKKNKIAKKQQKITQMFGFKQSCTEKASKP